MLKTERDRVLTAVRYVKNRRHHVKTVLYKAFVYLLLVNSAFIFLYPILYMATTAIMSLDDFYDPSVRWIPLHIRPDNFTMAFKYMSYLQAFRNSALIAVLSAIGQVLSTAIIGYGFARLEFPGRDVLFALVLLTIIVPPSTIIIPLYILYRDLHWLNSYYPMIVPSFFGFGLRGALFIFIFRQVFKGLPWELEDAARIDGANTFGIFWRIMLPLAKPGIVTVAIFSFVWHWNDYYEPMMYINSNDKFTLPLRLSMVWGANFGSGWVYSPVHIMASCLLVIAPSLIFYIFTQRYFVESIERTGITGD